MSVFEISNLSGKGRVERRRANSKTFDLLKSDILHDNTTIPTMNGVSSSSNRSKWTKESELHAPISKKDLKKLAKKAKSSPRSPQQNDKTEKPITIASKVDKHHLYMLSVQSPSLEIRNLINIYGEMSTKFRSVLPVKSLRKSKHASDTTINNNDEEEEEDLLAIPRIPLLLREDFCGTAILSREWCKTHVEREAYSTDLDTSVIAYARKQILEGGGPESDRVHVICDNVMNTEAKTDAGESAPLVDIIASLNYATFYFHRRKDLVEYLKLCRARLRKGGIMVTDMMGGSDVQLEKNMYKRELFSDQIGPFTYVCEQSGFNLLTNVINLALGFRFPDGKVFDY